MKNKTIRGKIIFAAAVILTLAIAVFIYKQPVEIEDMYKDWDFDNCTKIKIQAMHDADGDFYKTGDLDEYYYMLEKGDEGFNEIIALFDGKEFIKSFKRAGANVGGTAFAYVDFWWEIDFLADGKLLGADNFVGKKVTVSLQDKNNVDRYRIAIDKNDPWLKEVLDNIIKYEK